MVGGPSTPVCNASERELFVKLLALNSVGPNFKKMAQIWNTIIIVEVSEPISFVLRAMNRSYGYPLL